MLRAGLPVLVLFAALLDTAGCAPRYQGDGTLTDFGWGAARYRYVVDLGLIDLSRPNQRSFRMRGLPGVEFTMGLRQVNVSAGCAATALRSVRVRLDVQEEDGALVIAEEAPLTEWVPSSDLMYRRGAEREDPLGAGAVELVRVGTHASGGWGTYFTPRPSVLYLPRFTVLEASGASGCESRLVLLGGGWK